jgi:hypothetical protein
LVFLLDGAFLNFLASFKCFFCFEGAGIFQPILADAYDGSSQSVGQAAWFQFKKNDTSVVLTFFYSLPRIQDQSIPPKIWPHFPGSGHPSQNLGSPIKIMPVFSKPGHLFKDQGSFHQIRPAFPASGQFFPATGHSFPKIWPVFSKSCQFFHNQVSFHKIWPVFSSIRPASQNHSRFPGSGQLFQKSGHLFQDQGSFFRNQDIPLKIRPVFKKSGKPSKIMMPLHLKSRLLCVSQWIMLFAQNPCLVWAKNMDGFQSH